MLGPVREEIDAFLAKRGSAPAPPNANFLGLTYDDLTTALPVLRATAVLETLRLTVPGAMASRRAVADLKLKDPVSGRVRLVPAGFNVWVGLAMTAFTNPVVDDPSAFRASRFLGDGAVVPTPSTFPWFGYGGVRQCPGQRFAEIQLMTLTSLLAKRTDLALELRDDSKNIQTVFKPTFMPEKKACWIRVTRRA